MKSIIAIFSFVFHVCIFAQNCIDPSLIDPNVFCTQEINPVCGCDGITYQNACIAQTTAGVTSYTLGECALPDSCQQIPNSVNFGACAMALGWANYESGCQMVSGCSMIGSDGIDYSNSFFTSSYACNSVCMSDTAIILNCIDTSLIDLQTPCPNLYFPVCGCDSVTYFNACEAIYYHGVTQYTEGPCGQTAITEESTHDFLMLPNPFNDLLKITFFTPSFQKQLSLYGMDGVLLFREIFSEQFHVIDLSFLRNGNYMIEIQSLDDASMYHRKVIKL
jgi:hypothetical protein